MLCRNCKASASMSRSATASELYLRTCNAQVARRPWPMTFTLSNFTASTYLWFGATHSRISIIACKGHPARQAHLQ